MKTTTLFRPVNDKELALIEAMGFIFYPVMNEQYAIQITKEWNVPTYGIGYVTRFEVKSDTVGWSFKCIG